MRSIFNGNLHRAPSTRRWMLYLAPICLLLLCCAVYASAGDPADESPAAPELSPSWQKMYELADRFGNIPKPLPAPPVPEWPSLEQVATEMEEQLDIALAALAQSNAQGDLGAPPVPTGDALFDRYALAVDAQMRTLTPDGPDIPGYGVLPDELLAEWEPEFGQDPRYWELRYLCAEGQGEDPQLEAGFAAAPDFLSEARQRGAASANTLLLLANTLPEAAAAQRGELIEAALALDPDQAWAYYYRALQHFQLNELEQGLDDLAQGNAAPVNAQPQPYPLAELRQSLSGPAPLGSAAIGGALYMLRLLLPQRRITAWKEALNATLEPESEFDRGRVREEWHQFTCRYGATPVQAIDPISALVLCGYVRKAAEEDTAHPLTAAQQETCHRMIGAREECKRITKTAMFDMITESTAFVAAGGMFGLHVAGYLQAEAEAREHAACQAVFADLAQVHYPELATPACLLKYEALSQAEYERRKAERKAQRENSDSQVE